MAQAMIFCSWGQLRELLHWGLARALGGPQPVLLNMCFLNVIIYSLICLLKHFHWFSEAHSFICLLNHCHWFSEPHQLFIWLFKHFHWFSEYNSCICALNHFHRFSDWLNSIIYLCRAVVYSFVSDVLCFQVLRLRSQRLQIFFFLCLFCFHFCFVFGFCQDSRHAGTALRIFRQNP